MMTRTEYSLFMVQRNIPVVENLQGEIVMEQHPRRRADVPQS